MVKNASAASMTEKAAGAGATGMQTSAVLDGDEWVLNGEKWFSSSASVADIAVVVMAKTDPDAPRHEQYSTFIVELTTRAIKSSSNIETMQPHTELGLKLGGSHSEINIENLRVPRENLLGPRPRLQHGPTQTCLRPITPWHAQCRDGPASARSRG